MRTQRPAGATWEEEIVRCIESYPPPTSVGWELYHFLRTPCATSDGVTRIVAQDPLFAAEVMRQAPAVKVGQEAATSLQQAIEGVGFRQLARIALTYSYRNLAPDSLTVYNQDVGRFYGKSLACAVAMDFLSDSDDSLGGDWYVLGLLHAIGEIFIDAAVRWREDQPIRLMAQTPFKLAQIEECFLGLNQARVAGVALRAWHFPECVVVPIEQQFGCGPGARYFEVTQSLAVARYIACKFVDREEAELPPSAGKDHILFRKKLLSDVYAHVSKRCETALGVCIG